MLTKTKTNVGCKEILKKKNNRKKKKKKKAVDDQARKIFGDMYVKRTCLVVES